MKASELIEYRPFYDVLVYGKSGTGKTTWGAKAPRPLVVLSELHGLPSIVEANPNADVEIVESFDDVAEFMRAIKLGDAVQLQNDQPAYSFTYRKEERLCQTVVVDALSDIFTMVMRMCGGVKGGADIRKVPDLDPKKWGRVANIMESLLHDLRSLPVNIVCLALAESREDQQKRRYVTPALSGRTRRLIGQWFSAVGYAAKRENMEGELEHRIYWQMPSRYISKPAPGFPVSIHNTKTPGQTTLGSLLLATMPQLTVPAEDHDNASFIQEEKAKTEEGVKK